MEMVTLQKQSDLINLIGKYYSSSKEQLAAIKFIKEVVLSIQSYSDFQQYKNDVLEALHDTELTLLDTIGDMSSVICNKEESNKKKIDICSYSNSKSSIGVVGSNINKGFDINTASLGLRFNYDSYLNNEKKNVKLQDEPMQFNHKKQLQLKAGAHLIQNQHKLHQREEIRSQQPNKDISQQLQRHQQEQQQHQHQPLLNFDYSSNKSIDAISLIPKQKSESSTVIMNEPLPNQISIEKKQDNESSNPYNITFNPLTHKPNSIIASGKDNDQSCHINYKNADNDNDNHISNIISQPQQESSIQNYNEMETNDPIQNSTMIKQKASRLADLIMKINSDQEIYEIMIQLFDENILDNLMSSKATEEYIDSVEKSVKELERLREKDIKEEEPMNSQENLVQDSQNKSNTKINMNEELFYETPINNYLPIPIQIDSSNTMKANENQDLYAKPLNYHNNNNNIGTSKEKSFSDELLMSNGFIHNYNSISNHPLNDNVNVNTNIKTHKQSTSSNQSKILRKSQFKKTNNPLPPVSNYVNYTSPHGNYFDSSLQNGGITKIKTFKAKPNSAISPVREYIRSSHHLISNSLNHGRSVDS